MTNLMIPIDEILLARLQQLALQHGRDIETEARLLLAQSLEEQPVQGDFLLSFFKYVPAPQNTDEELIIESRSCHSDRIVNFE